MKKFNKVICLLLVMLLCFSPIGFISKAEAASPKPIVSAHAYIVMDAKSGKILYSQNPDKKIYPASTVKLMTALIAIEKCSLSKKITVKQSVLSKLPSDTTKAGLKAGYTYTLEELLNMLLVYSAADAASIIADAVAGSTSEFVKLMNQRAKLLEMNSTSFDNPIGLDGTRFPKTYSTANDITKLTRYTMKNTTIRNIVAKPSYTIKNFYKGSSKMLNCTNKFLRGQWYPKDLYKIIGTKTGTTDKAGYVLSTTAIDSKGREFICAFFGNATRTKMYENIEALLTYTYKNLRSS